MRFTSPPPRLVGRDVARDRHRDDHRRASRERPRHVRPHRLARRLAAAQEVVVLVVEVGPRVRGVLLPVVGGPAVAAEPPEPLAARAAAPVVDVRAVDVGRDRHAARLRVDRETDRPGRPGDGRGEAWGAPGSGRRCPLRLRTRTMRGPRTPSSEIRGTAIPGTVARAEPLGGCLPGPREPRIRAPFSRRRSEALFLGGSMRRVVRATISRSCRRPRSRGSCRTTSRPGAPA